MDYLTDPTFWRGIERIAIVLGGIICTFLGFRLYMHGIKAGRSELNFQSALMRFAVSGYGPGLMFMALGTIVLVMAVASKSTNETSEIKVRNGDRDYNLLITSKEVASDLTLETTNETPEIRNRASDYTISIVNRVSTQCSCAMVPLSDDVPVEPLLFDEFTLPVQFSGTR